MLVETAMGEGAAPATTAQPARDARRGIAVAMVGNVITQPFQKLAARLADLCDVRITHLDFGQVVQTLEGADAHEFLVLHLDHRWFFDIAPDEEAVDRARDLVDRARRWLDRTSGTLLLNTVAYLPRSSVDSDLHRQIDALHRVNRQLFDLAEASERVGIVDVAGVMATVGYAAGYRERNRLLMQAPYAPAAAEAIVDAYALTLTSFLRPRRKAIVIDADNTLWGGVVGEVGAEGVEVNREYPGIVHFTLQQQLKRLRALGILLCVVTKNNEADFLEVFNTRSMPLSLDDITAYRSNWQPKSENIASLAEQLNIGLDAFVFLDDNPFEIEEVATRLPGVDCRLFPRERPEAAIAVLDAVATLRARSITAEDAVKAEQYRIEAERKRAMSAAPTLADYLASLEIKVEASVNNPAHLRRVTQLINKTNQFNLTCRRYVEAEVEQAMAAGHVYDFKVSDRFGDMGIVAVAIVRDGVIENLLMSCRALGRQVEIAILRHICDRHPGVRGVYRAGPRNQMVADFYPDNGFTPERADDVERVFLMQQGPQDELHIVIDEH